MVPRRLHFSGTAGPEQISEGNDLSIDTEFLRKRELRKSALQPQPTTPIAENNPWADLDRSIARALPAFPDRMWTLGDTARWVIERTPEAVDGHSIDEDKLFEILPDIHGALSDGEVSAFAITQNDPVPRELPAATWSVYQLVVEEKNGLIRIFPLISSSTEHEQHLLNVKVKREDVLQRWPSSSPPSVPQTTMGAENQCRQWLATMMKEASAQPIPKATLRKEALTKFRASRSEGSIVPGTGPFARPTRYIGGLQAAAPDPLINQITALIAAPIFFRSSAQFSPASIHDPLGEPK